MLAYTFRAANSEDAGFVYAVAEKNFRGLVEGQGKKWAVARMQEQSAQQASSPSTSIIEIRGADAGFLTVEYAETLVRIDALLLLPEYQRQGVGSHIFGGIMARARAAGLPVHLSVYKANPARAFWDRHRFKVTGEANDHLQMARET
jgi:GNAT superfamily N-acetyltransferase